VARLDPKDIVARRFGRLVVTAVDHQHPTNKHWYYNCLCDCGKTRIVSRPNLLSNNQRSCGCLRDEVTIKRSTKHNGRWTRAYNIWCHMKARCSNPNVREFKWYGAKGVKVCDRWKESFANFFADMGECPPGYSIERNDVFGNYERSNCAWLPRKEQWRNQGFRVNGTKRATKAPD
jgi:hypothetical protein